MQAATLTKPLIFAGLVSRSSCDERQQADEGVDRKLALSTPGTVV